jgi:PhnB protein
MTGTDKQTSFVVHEVYPYLRVRDAGKAIDFYRRAFGAQELFRLTEPGGRIGHAEIKIGDSRIMLADEHPEIQALSPKTVGGSPVSIHLYVENVDAAVERAVAAGAKLVRPVADQFYGDRTGGIEDPFGYRWFIATHKEDLTMDEVRRRAAAQHT